MTCWANLPGPDHGSPGRPIPQDRPHALEVLTKSHDVSVRDDSGREAEEGLVDVVAAFPPDAEPFHAVVPGDRSLDHPPADAQSRAV